MLKKIALELKLIFVPSRENNYRPRFLESRFLTYYLIALLLLKLITIPILIYFPKSASFADLTKGALIALTNQERKVSGTLPLKEAPKLDKAAFLKAQDMLKKGYFSHQSPEGFSPWYWFKKVGYNYKFAGENLAIGFLDSEEVYQAWLNSPSHRANLLNPNYKEIGIAVARGNFQGNETQVVVQLFGSPRITKAPLEQHPKKESLLPKKETLPEKSEKKVVSGKEVLPAPEKETLPKKEVLPEKRENKDTISFSFFSFLTSDYFKLLQRIIYGSLILIIILLVLNVFVRFDIQHRDLIFKALGFMVLLILFIFLDKEVIIKLIPHSFSIY